MSAEHPTPWHLQGYTIRDAKGGVVVSAIAPCNMATRRQIIKAVNGTGTPQRNCDVGTVKEQNVRFEHFCFTHKNSERCCQDCPLLPEPSCELAWAQMPYEVERKGGCDGQILR